MRFSSIVSLFTGLLALLGIIVTFIYFPLPSLLSMVIICILAIIAGYARLHLPGTRLEIDPVNSVILTGIWVAGPYAWIATAACSIISPSGSKREKEISDWPHAAWGIFLTISAAFLYHATGGTLLFRIITPGLAVPLLLSIVLLVLFNRDDTFSLIRREKTAPKPDPLTRLLDFAFVPLGILMVLVWSNWNASYLILIVVPLVLAFLFLKRAFKNFEEKDDLTVFYNFTERISSSLRLEEILSLITDELMEVSSLEGCLLALLDEEKKGFVLSVSRGSLQSLSPSGLSPVREQILPLALGSVESRVIPPQEHQALYDGLGVSGREIAITPLLQEQTVIGFVLSAQEQFTEKDHQYLAIIASQASSVIVNADLYRKALKANEDLKQAQAQLIQSSRMAALGQLVAGIAHELNNPLGAVLTNFQTLPKFLKEDLHATLKDAEKAVIECKGIIEKLLRYSRQAQEGDHRVDLKTVVMDTMELMESQFAIDNITVSEDLRDTPPVMANANYLTQVLTNILMNAYDALLKADRPQKIIEVRSGKENTHSFFSVKDNGTGIPDEIVGEIFNPFFTTKESGKSAGLGLSISREIVERFGGTISVETEQDESTCFTVSLPVTGEQV